MKRKLIIMFTILTAMVLLLVIFNYKTIRAFFTHKDKIINQFKVGEVSANVTEPNYKDNQTIKPGGELIKDPTLTNTGKVNSYVRAQIYVPISNEIKYVDENEEIVTPQEDIEIMTYTVNEGWEEVRSEGYSGIYVDDNGNRYKVYTYKYVENGDEKVITPGEQITQPVFNKVKAINYLDIDEKIELNLHVVALAVQADGGTAEELWEYYKKQNGKGIIGVK